MPLSFMLQVQLQIRMKLMLLMLLLKIRHRACAYGVSKFWPSGLEPPLYSLTHIYLLTYPQIPPVTPWSLLTSH